MLGKLLAKLFGSGIIVQALSALIRHGLTALSGVLLGLGLDGKVVSQFITSGEQVAIALAGILVAYLMSLANKHKLLD